MSKEQSIRDEIKWIGKQWYSPELSDRKSYLLYKLKEITNK